MEAYEQQARSVKPLPGAAELLAELTARGVPWAIATSGYARTARLALGMLGLPEETPMVTRDLVRRAKPGPDLFLAGASLVRVDPRHAMVVGDSVWDLLAARRAGASALRLITEGESGDEVPTKIRDQRQGGAGAGRGFPGVRRSGGHAGQTRRTRRTTRRLNTGISCRTPRLDHAYSP